MSLQKAIKKGLKEAYQEKLVHDPIEIQNDITFILSKILVWKYKML